MNTKHQLYHNKSGAYYSHIREDIISVVPQSNQPFLEVGCGTGATLIELKKRDKAREVVGVDIKKTETELDNFIVGDIENLEIPYPENHFGVIICADVLEHLIDPWTALEKIVFYLRPGGYLITSLPNFREIHTLKKIVLKGDFAYQDAEVLDKTHLRFFCRKNMIELLTEGGLKVRQIHCFPKGKKRIFNKLTLGLLEEFLILQYIIVSQKTG